MASYVFQVSSIDKFTVQRTKKLKTPIKDFYSFAVLLAIKKDVFHNIEMVFYSLLLSQIAFLVNVKIL